MQLSQQPYTEDPPLKHLALMRAYTAKMHIKQNVIAHIRLNLA